MEGSRPASGAEGGSPASGAITRSHDKPVTPGRLGAHEVVIPSAFKINPDQNSAPNRAVSTSEACGPSQKVISTDPGKLGVGSTDSLKPSQFGRQISTTSYYTELHGNNPSIPQENRDAHATGPQSNSLALETSARQARYKEKVKEIMGADYRINYKNYCPSDPKYFLDDLEKMIKPIVDCFEKMGNPGCQEVKEYISRFQTKYLNNPPDKKTVQESYGYLVGSLDHLGYFKEMDKKDFELDESKPETFYNPAEYTANKPDRYIGNVMEEKISDALSKGKESGFETLCKGAERASAEYTSHSGFQHQDANYIGVCALPKETHGGTREDLNRVCCEDFALASYQGEFLNLIVADGHSRSGEEGGRQPGACDENKNTSGSHTSKVVAENVPEAMDALRASPEGARFDFAATQSIRYVNKLASKTWGGSTMTAVRLEGRDLYTTQLGDSVHWLLTVDGDQLTMMRQNRLFNCQDESARKEIDERYCVIDERYSVIDNERVLGALEVTSTVGDRYMLAVTRRKPECTRTSLDPSGGKQFLSILCSDGISDCLSSETLGKIINQSLRSHFPDSNEKTLADILKTANVSDAEISKKMTDALKEAARNACIMADRGSNSNYQHKILGCKAVDEQEMEMGHRMGKQDDRSIIIAFLNPYMDKP